MVETSESMTHPPRLSPPMRPEYLRDVVASDDIGIVHSPLTFWQRIAGQGWFRSQAGQHREGMEARLLGRRHRHWRKSGRPSTRRPSQRGRG
jgi:hypothetical protein